MRELLYILYDFYMCIIVISSVMWHEHKNTKQQSPLSFLLCPRSQSIYLSISVKHMGLCDVHENKAGR